MADVLEDSRDKVQENLLANGGKSPFAISLSNRLTAVENGGTVESNSQSGVIHKNNRILYKMKMENNTYDFIFFFYNCS